jgi:hypothetical protein
MPASATFLQATTVPAAWPAGRPFRAWCAALLDLSQAAARYLGVDTAPDRYVEFRIIALPGEEPPDEM